MPTGILPFYKIVKLSITEWPIQPNSSILLRSCVICHRILDSHRRIVYIEKLQMNATRRMLSDSIAEKSDKKAGIFLRRLNNFSIDNPVDMFIIDLSIIDISMEMMR